MIQSQKAPPCVFKQFRSDGALSYLFADPVTRQAALIDPAVEQIHDYRAFLQEHGLKLTWVLETHLHADHFSASHWLAAETGAGIGMSRHTESARATRRLDDGDLIRLGELSLQCLLTPGHTEDSACFFSPQAPGMIFTGDTLLIGSTGRTDFVGSDPHQIWKSLKRLQKDLGPDVLVFPGHDYQDLVCSTMKTENESNPHLRISTEQDFVSLKREEGISQMPDEVLRRVQFNLEKNPSSEAAQGFSGPAAQCGSAGSDHTLNVGSIQVEKYKHKLAESRNDALFLDVRERAEFADGHIPGVINVPLSEIGFFLSRACEARKVYISCLSGRRSLMAAKTLTHLGCPDVINVVGGFQAWCNAGLEVEK